MLFTIYHLINTQIEYYIPQYALSRIRFASAR